VEKRAKCFLSIRRKATEISTWGFCAFQTNYVFTSGIFHHGRGESEGARERERQRTYGLLSEHIRFGWTGRGQLSWTRAGGEIQNVQPLSSEVQRGYRIVMGQNAARADSSKSMTMRRREERRIKLYLKNSRFCCLEWGTLGERSSVIGHWRPGHGGAESSHPKTQHRLLAISTIWALFSSSFGFSITNRQTNQTCQQPSSCMQVQKDDNAVGHVTLTSTACHESCMTGTLALTQCCYVCSSVSQETEFCTRCDSPGRDPVHLLLAAAFRDPSCPHLKHYR